MTNSDPGDIYFSVPAAIATAYEEYEAVISRLQVTIAELKNDCYDLRAKLLDRDQEIAELKGITQDILVAAGELVKRHGR
jgi:hypothetical protein